MKLIIASSVFAIALTLHAQEPARTMPDKLVTLRANYERAIERAKAPINLQYRNALQRLRTEYTKAGNLDAALAVDKELKSRFTDPSAPPSSSSLASRSYAKINAGNMTISKLAPGKKLYEESEYVWTSVPEAYSGMHFAQPKNKHTASTTFDIESDGLVYLAIYSRIQDEDADKNDNMLSRRDIERQGWKEMKGENLLSTEDNPKWLVFAKVCKAGESFTLRTDKYCAPIVLIK